MRTRRRPVAMQGQALLDASEPSDGVLASGTSVPVTSPVVDEIAFVEAAIGPSIGGQWLGNERRDSRLLALANLLAVEVATVSQYPQPLTTGSCFRLVSHRGKQVPVLPLAYDVVGYDQLVLGNRPLSARCSRRCRCRGR